MTTKTNGPQYSAALAHQTMFGKFVNPTRWFDLTGWHTWIADNGAFKGFDQDVFYKAIRVLLPYKSTCKAIVVPDVPFHWDQTLAKFRDWSPSLRRMGFPIALAVQDGATPDNIPFGEIDALFVGGSTEWKRQQTRISHHAELPLFSGIPVAVSHSTIVSDIVREAKARGLWVHIGRSANSIKQLWYAYQLGADSVDGTKETYAPNREFVWISQTMFDIHKYNQRKLANVAD